MGTERERVQIVVIGGGTGTHTVLTGLAPYADTLDITAIVSMADSGGSTGRLRDTFGFLPVGDVRMALSGLARNGNGHESLMRELFLYRFARGEGLAGHNFGNLLLTALRDITGSEEHAVAAASAILRVRGTVLPVTTDDVQLCATYSDGTYICGEAEIDDPPRARRRLTITELSTEPTGQVTRSAADAIRTADAIVLGPGDLYSSLLANCVIGGVPEAIQESAGELIHIGNLMERPGQTIGMTAGDSVAELERYIGRRIDHIILNNAPLPEAMVEHYKTHKEGTAPIPDDLTGDPRVARTDLLLREAVAQSEHDTVERSLIRHDPERLATALVAHVHSHSS